jgi:hypothetical protein
MYICNVIQKYILLFHLILLSLNSKAQTPSFYTIGTEEFSNINIYTLFYDDDTDILYVGTNRGLYFYAQNKFTPCVGSKEQIGNSLFNLKRDNDGGLFCSNLHGQIFKIEGNKLNLFWKSPKNENSIDFDFYFDDNNNLLYSTRKGLKSINSEGVGKDLINDDLNTLFGTTGLKYGLYGGGQLPNGSIYGSVLNGSDSYNVTYLNNETKVIRISETKENMKSLFFQLGNQFFYNSKSGIINVVDGKIYTYRKLLGHAVSYDKNWNKMTILNSDKGLHHLELFNDSIDVSLKYFANKFISTMTSNGNRTAFLGTFKEGIIVVPNWDIMKYENNFSLEEITSSGENEVYLSNNANKIFKHNNGPKIIPNYLDYQKKLFTLKGSYNGIDNGILYNDSTQLFFDNVKDLVEVENEFIIYINPKSIHIIPQFQIDISPSFATKHKEHYFISLNNRGRSVTYDKNNECLYYSTSAGVYSKKWNTSITDTLVFEGENIQGNKLTLLDDQLIIGSDKHGVLFYESNECKRIINSDNGLKSNSVLKLEVKEELLFIITTVGLQIYNLKTDKFIGIGEKEGIAVSKVIDFSISDDKLWLLDTKGYYSYELNKLTLANSTELGHIYLDSILINNKRNIDSNHLTFTFDENDVQFYFDYRDIETKKEAMFSYKLIGVSDEWKTIETSLNELSFPSLSPGKYTFVLNASYRNNKTKNIEYEFEILPPFWFQLWFVILMIFLIVLLVSFLFIFQIKKKEKQRNIESKIQNMKTDIFESKLEAIRSQMNPHFIFNSLNSIQALVLKKDIKKSYDYIEMFSDLVRKTLIFSEKNYIDINEETNFLRIYLNLESLRMKDEFSFIVENNSNKEILIPSLLIQPFLENAIHHGLLHKKGKKELSISFNCENGIGTCVIQDNGIGREKANEIKNRQKFRHESFSLNAMKKRLEILSEQNNDVFDYVIEDLYSKEGVASGTKVIVNFPFKYEY